MCLVSAGHRWSQTREEPRHGFWNESKFVNVSDQPVVPTLAHWFTCVSSGRNETVCFLTLSLSDEPSTS